MKAIDRVMLAYRKAHKLTEREDSAIRAQLSIFIDELLAGRLLIPKKQIRTPSDSN